MTARDLKAALRVRYSAPEWALFSEVRSCTGHATNVTYADMLGVSTYASRGFEVIGFEIKVSRGDWLRERAKPDKAEGIARFCDHWYVVTDDPNIVKLDELPLTWGLLVYKTSKFQVVKKAVTLTPEPFTREFTVSLLRSALKDGDGYVHRDAVDALVDKRVHDKVELVRDQLGHELTLTKSYLRCYTQYEDRLLAFKQTVDGVVAWCCDNPSVFEHMRNDTAISVDQVLMGIKRQRQSLQRAIELLDATEAVLTETP